ncbi:hypothetical protein JWS13_37565 [Rhodococcus pseudokoreensis]|uniref:Uncharacterized protein n=1 Tax=Rhodococcus pseudokoreensis TaxID=2811421 RepID=A0A974ZXA2_9NOCA|nr:hypothetical protein [Rhodococcus pseudokoreensis]QSE93906.1 hypothetical protein JWS13_37565 [Rhodococcus pseudokoreensis]
MSTDIRPYFVPNADDVAATPWRRLVDDEWEELDEFVEDWDYRTYLRLRCSLSADASQVRAAAHLTDGSPLAWYCGWYATDTRLVAPSVRTDFKSGPVDVDLIVDPNCAGTTIAITRRLVLERDRLGARPGEVKRAGSVLWQDQRLLRLTGTAAMFPTEIVDFAAIGKDPRASWFLELPLSADEPAMGSMILLINQADKELVAAVTRTKRHSERQEALIQGMEEGLAEEIVRWALARWDELEGSDLDSFGFSARILTQRILTDPVAWASEDGMNSMALRAAVVSGARVIGFGRSFT